MQGMRRIELCLFAFGFAVMSLCAVAQVQLVPVTPCRAVDTRRGGSPIQGGTCQDFTISGPACGIPAPGQGKYLCAGVPEGDI